jgi:hypothetical protein
MNEHDFEPIPGLPERLPPGERIVWQGSPHRGGVARRVFHVRKLAIYFAVLLLWFAVSRTADGHAIESTALPVLWLTLVAAAAIATMVALAWLIERTTLYTITTKRLVIRFGIALPMTVNIPFRVVRSADLKAYADGTGDLALALNGRRRLPYLALWPHARPWRLSQVEPTLRVVPEAAKVAEILSQALAAGVQPARAITGAPPVAVGPALAEHPRASAVA